MDLKIADTAHLKLKKDQSDAGLCGEIAENEGDRGAERFDGEV